MLGNGSDRINAGEIMISLTYKKDGSSYTESLTLRPTMRAADLISAQASNWGSIGGLAGARKAVLEETRAAVVFIIRVATGMSDKDARRLPDKVWENGLDLDLLMPLMEYLAVLNNGGRPLSNEERAVYRTINMGGSATDMQQIEHDGDERYPEGNG